MADDAGGPADAIEAALTDMVTVLTRAKVPYALIGGLATGYRSRPWYTKDVDLILDIPQITLPAVLAALGGLGFEFNERDVIAEFYAASHGSAVARRGARRLAESTSGFAPTPQNLHHRGEGRCSGNHLSSPGGTNVRLASRSSAPDWLQQCLWPGDPFPPVPAD